MQGNAESLGSCLRRERELREVSLQDISVATKIQLRFLEALEGDQYDQLPPAPFAVGFLRAYAQYLSLAPEEVVAAYHARYGQAENHLEGQRLLVSYPVGRPVHVQRPRRSGRLASRVLVGLGLIAVGLGVYVLWRGPAEKGIGEVASWTTDRTFLSSGVRPEAPPAAPAPSILPERVLTPAPAPVPPIIESMPPPPAGPAAVERAPGRPLAAVEAPTPLILQAVATEDTWLRIEVDGEKRQDMLLAPGKQVRWEARERFVVTVGKARGMRLTLNGKDLQLPVTRGNVVRDYLVTRALLNEVPR